MSSALTFEVPGQPVPFTRTQSSGKRRFTPERYRSYKRLVGTLAQCAVLKRDSWPMDARYRLTVEAANGDRIRRDIDNLAKSVLDGANGIIWEDDHQVDELIARKAQGCAEPFLRVTVEIIEKEGQ